LGRVAATARTQAFLGSFASPRDAWPGPEILPFWTAWWVGTAEARRPRVGRAARSGRSPAPWRSRLSGSPAVTAGLCSLRTPAPEGLRARRVTAGGPARAASPEPARQAPEVAGPPRRAPRRGVRTACSSRRNPANVPSAAARQSRAPPWNASTGRPCWERALAARSAHRLTSSTARPPTTARSPPRCSPAARVRWP
jgi:hypothetical protein